MKEEKKQNDTVINKKKEIVLNKDIDLYKTSIKTIKESKLSSFKGTLLNNLLTEMMKSEQNEEIIVPKNSKETTKNNIKKHKNNNSIRIIYKKMNSFNKTDGKKTNAIRVIPNNKLNRSTFLNNKTLIKNQYITKKEFKLEKIIFQMKYNTQMGEDLGVIGSINELGSWDQRRALKMTWYDQNIWRGEMIFNNSNIYDFEYKFIFIAHGSVKQWESGNNRKFILSQIKGLIESCPGGGTIIHLKNISGQNIDYNYNDSTITIISEWNRK
jgi:hypothetical protein